MTPQVAQRLNRLNQDFYQSQAASFSETRHSEWPGWEQLAHAAALVDAAAVRRPYRVLDLACGNLRFGRFLQGILSTGASVDYYAVDSCPDFLGSWRPDGWGFHYQDLDLVTALLSGEFDASLNAPACDLVVAMGFLHHIPTSAVRERFLRCMLDRTAPGGICCASFWRFTSEPKMAAKARQTTAQGLADLGMDPADLDPEDYLLSWQDVPHVYRYCHGFCDAEVDRLAATLSNQADVVARFCADGRTGALNGYLVLRRR